MNIQHLALQLGNSPATASSCSQKHLSNTVRRTASSSTQLTQFQTEKMERKCMVSLFIYIWHIRKEVFKLRQPLSGMPNRFWLEKTLTTARLPQAQLCIWFRCQLLLQRMVPLLPLLSQVRSSSTGSWISQRQQLYPTGFGSPSAAAQGTLLPSAHQAEINPDSLLTLQESVWKLQSFPMCAPKNAFLSPAREGWYPHQYTQFSHISHLFSFPSAWHWKALQKQNTTLWF